MKGICQSKALVAFFPMNASLSSSWCYVCPPPAWETLCLEVDQATGSYRRNGCMSGVTPSLFSGSIQLLLCSLSLMEKKIHKNVQKILLHKQRIMSRLCCVFLTYTVFLRELDVHKYIVGIVHLCEPWICWNFTFQFDVFML